MTDRYKQILRQTCQQTRKKLSHAYQRDASQRVCKKIAHLEQYRYAKHIALYQAVNGEIDLRSIWRSAPLQGKYCYFPALNDDGTLAFLPATPASIFHKNRFDIEEPVIERSQAVLPENLSIMFIPLVAFDLHGTRLGMGAGYYDKTLALSRPPLLVGVAYEFQRQSFIEPEAWDIPLDVIITEQAVYWRK